jgi:hypothetical protein
MYISYIPGRVRIRLKDYVLVERIAQMVQNMPGMQEITINPKTGSLLVLYDKHLLDEKNLKKLIETYMPQVAKLKPTSGNKSENPMKMVKKGMLASLGLSLSSVLLDQEEFHIVMGLLFLGFLSYHIFTYRKRLIT